MTNVGNYTDKQILDRVASKAKGFIDYPKGPWIIGIASKEDSMTFDDKFYLFNERKFIAVTSGTTNKGHKGTAVLCRDYFTYDCYAASDGKKVRHHNGKMPCLRQVKSIPYQRDFSKDGKTNPTTKIYYDIISTNFHACDYDMSTTFVKENIGGWSEGCPVVNNIPMYLFFLEYVRTHGGLSSLCLLNEF